MIKQIDHIGIAVQSLDEAIPFYQDVLKLEFKGIETVEEQKVRIAVFQTGEVQIELLEPTSFESPVAKHLALKGPGLHHIEYRTDQIENEIEALIDKNVLMIDDKPRTGIHQTRIAFIHPKSSGKVLTEICQIRGESQE